MAEYSKYINQTADSKDFVDGFVAKFRQEIEIDGNSTFYEGLIGGFKILRDNYPDIYNTLKKGLPDGGEHFDAALDNPKSENAKKIADDLVFDMVGLVGELFAIVFNKIGTSRVGNIYNLIINTTAFAVDTATNTTSSVDSLYLKVKIDSDEKSINKSMGEALAVNFSNAIIEKIKSDTNDMGIVAGGIASIAGIAIGLVLSKFIVGGILLTAGISIVSFWGATYIANEYTQPFLEKIGLLGANDAKYLYSAENGSTSLISGASFATLLKNHWSPDENNGIKYHFERTSSVEDLEKDFFQIVSSSASYGETPFVMKIKNKELYFKTMTLDELTSSNSELEEVLKYVQKGQEVVFYTKDNLEDEQTVIFNLLEEYDGSDKETNIANLQKLIDTNLKNGDKKTLYAVLKLESYVLKSDEDDYKNLKLEDYRTEFINDRKKMLVYYVSKEIFGETEITPDKHFNDVKNDFDYATWNEEKVVFGTENNDKTIAGNESNNKDNFDDYLYGMAGDDTLDGKNGVDYIEGGSGNDHIYGGDGHDLLFGNSGDDHIYADTDTQINEDGSANSDKKGLYNGGDLIVGGDGSDTIYAGGGHDVIYTGEVKNDENAYKLGLGSIVSKIPGSNDDKSDQRDEVYAGKGSDTIYGSNGKDIVYGSDTQENTDREFSEAEKENDKDTIYGYKGDDKLLGQDGEDTIFGGDDGDIISGGDGNDFIYADADDLQKKEKYNNKDVILGGKGDDTIYAGGGNDIIFTSDIADKYSFLSNFSLDTIKGIRDEYGGTDSETETGINTVIAGVGKDIIFGSNGMDLVRGGTSEKKDNSKDVIYGYGGKDILIGDGGDDYLHGGKDDVKDILDGGIGKDTYIAYANDVIYDIDGQGSVRFNGELLSGSYDILNLDEKIYGKEKDDFKYKKIGSGLEVTNKKGEKIYLYIKDSITRTITDWKDGDLGITLLDNQDITVTIEDGGSVAEAVGRMNFDISLSRPIKDGENLVLNVKGENIAFNSGDQKKTYTYTWQDNNSPGSDRTVLVNGSIESIIGGAKVIIANQATGVIIDDDPRRSDPLVLDTNKDGFISTYSLEESTAYFDLTGDGLREKVGWIKPEDGILTYDKNENGQIDGISEVFGNMTKSGFDELKEIVDSNRDNIIDKKDELFYQLQVWNDKNSDGKADEHELTNLVEADIESIDLNMVETNIELNGNILSEASKYSDSDGNKELVADIQLSIDGVDTKVDIEDIPDFSIDESTRELPNIKGSGLVYNSFINYNLDEEFKAVAKDYTTDIKKVATNFDEFMESWSGYTRYINQLKEQYSVEDDFDLVENDKIVWIYEKFIADSANSANIEKYLHNTLSSNGIPNSQITEDNRTNDIQENYKILKNNIESSFAQQF